MDIMQNTLYLTDPIENVRVVISYDPTRYNCYFSNLPTKIGEKQIESAIKLCQDALNRLNEMKKRTE